MIDRGGLLLAAAAGVSLGVWWWIKTRKVKRKPRQVVFAITGFGKFAGVEENPTAIIVKALPTWLRTNPLPKNATVDRCQILEVSAEGSREGLASMRETCFEQAGQMRVWIHLGVDAKSTTFKLERCAWNEAAFRIPDERGWEPKSECIEASAKLGTCLQTLLPISQLCTRLKSQGHSVESSKNPGRFVCNWLYYISLKACFEKTAEEKSRQKGRTSSSSTEIEFEGGEEAIFVHVPPFGVFDSSQQLSFLHSLLACISQQLCSKELVA